MKNGIYSWIWKWHFIAGILSLPVIILLSVTGSIYLFKDNYEQKEIALYSHIDKVENRMSYQDQWEIVKQKWQQEPDALKLPLSDNEATEFTSGSFSHKSRFFLNPYTGIETGKVQLSNTDMHQVRKLHGELLMGKFGTKIVELTASWMVVLLLTGIYIFWPRGRGWKGLFWIRTKESKRILFRDIHSVTGFWFSLILLILLAGGLPWTDVFGSGYSWVQKKTDSGYPATWNAKSFSSTIDGEAISLDQMIEKAKTLNLAGEVSIELPTTEEGVYTISNQIPSVSEMKKYHYDQYSGELLNLTTGNDFGLMIKTRIWVMAFHQGQLGTWNFALVLITALALLLISVTGLCSYIYRKKKGSWSIPDVPDNLHIGKFVIVAICLLGILLPLFGLSIILIVVFSKVKQMIQAK